MVRTLARPEFLAWQRKLRDHRAAEEIAIAIAKLRHGLGKVRGLAGGLNEVKIEYGPGYRLYFTHRGEDMIVLLCGGDKSSQRRDIRRAREIMKRL